MIVDDSKRNLASAGIFAIADGIAEELAAFIEASYHVKNDALIEERAELLRTWGVLRQRPYIEASPTYLASRRLENLSIPDAAKKALSLYVGRPGGFFNPPFEHQAKALESFFNDGDDLIIATGTGSGKTEAFFMPVIATLENELEERPATAKMPALRALLVYPMNALVNDQQIRLRRLLGDDAGARRVTAMRGRPIRFASYTGRTPYPGPRSSARDTRYVEPLFKDFYLSLIGSQSRRQILRAVGRWPAKDLEAFYAGHLERKSTYKSGKYAGRPRIIHNWSDRLKTQALDAELMTRHEALAECPDVLITNYSMLEYMLLRPLERGIFESTARWLAADHRNQLVLVIDEAHLYRGAAGAEVALLLRRLASRLGVPRTRIRAILTSASIAGGAGGEDAAVKFACDLTGDPEPRQFAVVRATEEPLGEHRPLSRNEAEALAKFPIESFYGESGINQGSINALLELSRGLGIEAPSADESVDTYLARTLAPMPFVHRLLHRLSVKPIELEALSAEMCDLGKDVGHRALSALLVLCAAALRPDGRRLLSARLHLFARGLPALWACADAECTERRSALPGAIVGRLFISPVERCECSRGARVFELLTHRDCGAAFLQGFVTSRNSEFIWSEPGSLPDSAHPPRRLRPIELLVEGEPNAAFGGGATPALLDVRTGRLSWGASEASDGFRRVWVPDEDPNGNIRFRRCPICLGTWRSQQSAIERHASVGEGSFSVITRAQLRSQPAVSPRPDQLGELERYPNQGRKVLVFSDGRQRAAKLARVMPDLAQQDAFRQALLTAADRLSKLGRQTAINNRLYTAFVDVVSESGATFFAGPSHRELSQHIYEYRRNGSDLSDALDEPFDRRPQAFDRALLDTLGGRFYSLESLAIAFVEPTEPAMRQLLARIPKIAPLSDPEAVRALGIAWITEALRDYAFDERLAPADRRAVAHYYRDNWGFDSKFSRSLTESWSAEFGPDDLEIVGAVFSDVMLAEGLPGQRFLNTRQLRLTNALDLNWYHCKNCQSLKAVTLHGRCISCLSKKIEILAASDPYITARKDFWRAPIRRAISGVDRIQTMVAAEHTAQLSHRDRASVYSTTERHELLFQDILIAEDERPIDVLSCTTTMEVGIDIGALVAVGLRNIPPERANYQQRAGRAGRRGASLSTVISFADRGPHDSYYFTDPTRIISGAPRTPEIKIDNQKLVRRHVNAVLLQRFFASCVDQGVTSLDTSATLEAALGPTYEFFRDSAYGAGIDSFGAWVRQELSGNALKTEIAQCLPRLSLSVSQDEWILEIAEQLLARLEILKDLIPKRAGAAHQGNAAADEEITDEFARGSYPRQLLEFCSQHSLLPTYALPVDLAAFQVDEATFPSDFWRSVKIVELPQQDMGKALSEYAPGRIVTINGIDYRSGGVSASTALHVRDRAVQLFDRASKVWFCSICSAVRVDGPGEGEAPRCSTCGAFLESHLVLQPEVFYPEDRDGVSDDDRAQERTYATGAQLPLPTHEESLPPFAAIGSHLAVTHATDQELVSVNKGLHELGDDTGFWVCQRCGFARLDRPSDRAHTRPYIVEGPRDKDMSSCRGSFANVFLGRRFRTDLLVLRFTLDNPFVTDLHSPSNLILLHDAFTTISQALVIATSRHRELDVDPQEFGSGYRFVPGGVGTLRADVYIYDTLSGGAGYADIAGAHISEIIRDSLTMLEECPSGCARSCPDCLRHFRNQHLAERLDRKLGAQLLRYALFNEMPTVRNMDSLTAAVRGWLTSEDCEVEPSPTGFAAVADKSRVEISVVPALTSPMGLISGFEHGKITVTDFLLERDLPHCHLLVRQSLGFKS